MKLVVWECDRCSDRKEQDEMPEGWATAVTSMQEPADQGGAMEAGAFLWCNLCWKEIKRKLSVVQAAAVVIRHDVPPSEKGQTRW